VSRLDSQIWPKAGWTIGIASDYLEMGDIAS